MHWSHAENPRLRDLALDNILYTYGSEIRTVDDAYHRDYDALTLAFGSTGVDIRLRVFDSEAKTAFMHGCCVLLALALAEKMELVDPNFQVITVSMEHGWSGHVALLLDEDTAMDFYGARPVAEVAHDYRSAESVVWDRKTVIAELMDEPYQEDPLSFLEELERMVTEDFASEIVRQHHKNGPGWPVSQ